MLEHAWITDPGGRSLNEDAVGIRSCGDRQCFIVCDGLGGHGMGDIASRLVADLFISRLSEKENASDFLSKTFLLAQNALTAKQNEMHMPSKMKTTAVVLYTAGDHAYVGHVGDSRLYCFGGGAVKWRTRDHSVPEMLVRLGEIQESDIRFHPERNCLVRAMGIEWEKPMFELAKPFALDSCEAFLLCSDGFWELITEEEMCRMLQQSDSAAEWLDAMSALVQKNGKGRSMDNFSAIALRRK